jgi:hypothetical protein
MSAITRIVVRIDFSGTSVPVLEPGRVLAKVIGAQERASDPVAARTA